MQPLPLPADYGVFPDFASEIVRVGDTLAYAVPINTPKWPLKKVTLFRLVGGDWRVTIVGTYAATQLSLSYDGGYVLAVVEPDSTLDADASSLFLYQQRDGWRRGRKIASGAVHWVCAARLALRASPAVLSWMSMNEDGKGTVQALFDPLHSQLVRTIAHRADQYSLLAEPHRPLIWAIGRYASASQIIVDVRMKQGRARPVRVGSVAAPFAAPAYGAVRTKNGLLLSGPIVVSDSLVATSMAAYRIDCSRS